MAHYQPPHAMELGANRSAAKCRFAFIVSTIHTGAVQHGGPLRPMHNQFSSSVNQAPLTHDCICAKALLELQSLSVRCTAAAAHHECRCPADLARVLSTNTDPARSQMTLNAHPGPTQQVNISHTAVLQIHSSIGPVLAGRWFQPISLPFHSRFTQINTSSLAAACRRGEGHPHVGSGTAVPVPRGTAAQ